MKELRRSARKGFTLVELLTVIAIIAVLAAILFPVITNARERGRKTNCMSNLNQLGVAFQTYVQDTGGFLPTWCITHNGGPVPYTPQPPDAIKNKPDPSVITWDLSLGSYIRDDRILLCRSNPNNANARAYAITEYTQRRVSTGGNTSKLFGVFQDSIPAPSRTVLLFEKGANRAGSWGDALGQNVFQSHSSEGNAGYSDEAFHDGGKNFLYVDGHVKFDVKGQGPFAFQSTRTGAKPGDAWVAGRQKSDGTGGDWPNPN